MPGAKLEIADVFRHYGPSWRRVNKGHVSLNLLKVMSTIEACRTDALGGHVAACAKCNHQHVAYSCRKNRHCPKCQSPATRDWMEARSEGLLPTQYFHLVFTLPAEIAQIAYWNKRAVYGLLFKASSKTVSTIAADPKRLGARVGMTSVLHTWGSALTHHPHIHMIVPGGGVSPDRTKWLACKPGFFLHVRVLSRLFRRLFIEGMLALHRTGDLNFFGDLAGLSNADTVTFHWKDYRIKSGDPMPGSGLLANHEREHKVMHRATDEFIRRFLINVLPDGFLRIRHYSLLASLRRTANIASVLALLGAASIGQKDPRPTEAEPLKLCEKCPDCGEPMRIIERFRRGHTPRTRAPP